MFHSGFHFGVSPQGYYFITVARSRCVSARAAFCSEAQDFVIDNILFFFSFPLAGCYIIYLVRGLRSLFDLVVVFR